MSKLLKKKIAGNKAKTISSLVIKLGTRYIHNVIIKLHSIISMKTIQF